MIANLKIKKKNSFNVLSCMTLKINFKSWFCDEIIYF